MVTVALRYFFFIFIFASISQAHINVQLPNSTCNNSTDLILAVNDLPRCTAEAIFTSLATGLVLSAQQFYDMSTTFLTASPEINWFCAPFNSIMAIIETFYSVMLMGLGAYYIINSADVDGRARSKLWLKNAFCMVILLSFSFGLFGLLLDLNQQLSSTIYSSVSQSLFDNDAQLSDLIFAFLFAISLSMGGFLTFFTLLTRYLMVPFLLFLFPFAIFLYFVPPTREWGAFIFKFIFLIVFMTSIDAILLLGISYLFSSPDPNLANPLVKSFGLMAGFGLIGLVNLIIYMIAVLSVVFRAIKALESVLSLLSKLALIAAFM